MNLSLVQLLFQACGQGFWAFSPSSWPVPTLVLLGQPLSLVPTLSPNDTPPTPFPAAPAAANSSSGSRALWEGAAAEP